ncbi:hypothetical protein SAY86_032188 [Trapa natans]|uniref:Uncharacterized protein n=1 Tax=Trapa natans TaxID=22666 RepID=A0AAN7LT44_TRANT|nr:hypothetical protein SAY86_032188 [Trapa natans]
MQHLICHVPANSHFITSALIIFITSSYLPLNFLQIIFITSSHQHLHLLYFQQLWVFPLPSSGLLRKNSSEGIHPLVTSDFLELPCFFGGFFNLLFQWLFVATTFTINKTHATCLNHVPALQPINFLQIIITLSHNIFLFSIFSNYGFSHCQARVSSARTRTRGFVIHYWYFIYPHFNPTTSLPMLSLFH